MTAVMDSSALLALLQGEQGAGEVRSILLSETCVVHALNLCEVYYDLIRRDGETIARRATAELLSLGLVLREDMGRELWMLAGFLKAEHRRISLADCFCLALARRVGGAVVTADHHEFDALAEQGVCPIRFIR